MMEMYGATPGDGSFASNCLLARRLAERGVRFIQLYHRDWDHHSGVEEEHRIQGGRSGPAHRRADQDLKQRGMLDDTLVIWGGEFGRTPMSQGGDGRDHHIKGFSFMVAGGGIKKRHSRTARPMSWATRRWRIRSACTISTPRCCICWAVDHKR